MNTVSTCHNIFNISITRANGEVEEHTTKNAVVIEGHNFELECLFRSATQVATWYLGLIGGSGVLAAADTMLSHSGWTEIIGWSEATRQSWGPDAAANRSVSNSTVVEYNINATDTLKGVFLTSDSTKNGTAGLLYSTAPLSDIAINSGDTVRITYTVTLAA